MLTRPSLAVPLTMAALVGGITGLVAGWPRGWAVALAGMWSGATLALVGVIALVGWRQRG